jgi:chemotaxis response regulator CheB
VAAPARLQSSLGVALLGRADAARASLRRALEDLGVQVVFEGDPSGLQPDQVLQAGPSVVLVNLGSGVEDDIDHLDSLFDSPEVNVVFNEADVSSQLEGWDLARWARHLAAKITGRDATIPPPPPGAEPLTVRNFMPVPGAPPTPAQLTVERPIEEFMIEAEERVEDVPSDHLPYASPKRAPAVDEPEPEFHIDTHEVEGALAQIGGPAPTVEVRAVPEPEVPEIIVHEDEAAEFDAGLDLVALDAALELDNSPPPATAGKSDAALLDEALAGYAIDFIEEADADSTPDAADASDRAPPADRASFGTLTLSDDGLGLDVDEENLLDDDVAALAAQLDAMQDTSRSAVEDLRFEPVPEDIALEPIEEPVAPARAAEAEVTVELPVPAAVAKPSFGLLDLAPLDMDFTSPPTTAAAAPSAIPEFDFGNLNLSLEPTEEELLAAAPAAKRAGATYLDLRGLDSDTNADLRPAAAVDALLAEMDLGPAAASNLGSQAIPRVIVLGASIGGPDAVRTFLGGIPEGFPALFLLVQHLENGFFERLAQQLQKSAKLPVRVPDPATPARAGEILVIPAQQRVRIETDGQITLGEHLAPPKYTPSIDDVLRDTADRFGSAATAIIFSGMAGDAIEGAVYLTSLGGEVWAQDPSSCVVSSMVDGARARGVVEFLGSPRELAERCVEKYGK